MKLLRERMVSQDNEAGKAWEYLVCRGRQSHVHRSDIGLRVLGRKKNRENTIMGYTGTTIPKPYTGL